MDFAARRTTAREATGPASVTRACLLHHRRRAIPYAAHFCEVAVNMRTGAIEVRRYHAVHDSGTPINPELAAGTGVRRRPEIDRPCALRGDALRRRRAAASTTRLADYGAPMIQELPRDFDVAFVVKPMIPSDPSAAKASRRSA